jgi:hypothetical protein
MQSPGGSVLREIEVGEFNDEFIEIKNGLKEGEKVLLNAPEAEKSDAPDKRDEKTEEPPAQSKPSPAKV